jgi:hypothetical protein
MTGAQLPGMNTALVNHSQYVTATDRVLAAGRITKRRGPHTMHRRFEYTPQHDEAIVYVRERPRHVRSATRLVAAAVALLLAGGLAGARIAHASSAPASAIARR